MANNKHLRNEHGGFFIKVRDNNVDQAMRKLKKKLMNDGIMQEIRNKKHFVSKTEKRLQAEAASRARHKRRIAKEDNR
jgi:small subunit ribosomal protein S21